MGKLEWWDSVNTTCHPKAQDNLQERWLGGDSYGIQLKFSPWFNKPDFTTFRKQKDLRFLYGEIAQSERTEKKFFENWNENDIMVNDSNEMGNW